MCVVSSIVGAQRPPFVIKDASGVFVVLILGDSQEILAKNALVFDTIITDPPYGLKKELKRAWHGRNGKTKFFLENEWDIRMDSFVASILERAKQVIIWGGNFYALPPTDSWLVWDKLQDNRGSDAELAWARLPKRGCRVFRMSRIDAYFNKRKYPKEHPTEKPIQLMTFCVEKTTGVVCDMFMGVGSTGLACWALKRSFIGIEKNPLYYDIAVRRFNEIKGLHSEECPPIKRGFLY